MQDISLKTRFAQIDHAKACRALAKERRAKKGFWDGFFGSLIICFGIGGVAGAVAAIVGGNLGGTLAYVIGFGGLIALFLFRAKQSQGQFNDAKIRAGDTNVRLSPDGYTATHAGYDSFTRWSHVHGALCTPNALLILHSDFEYFPIEAASFEDEAQMQEIATQIESWIAQKTQSAAASAT